MRRDGLWHPRLMHVITAMGHTDTLVVADAGFPAPRHVECIDLGWWRGEPGFIPVLKAILTELVVEKATLADETRDPALVEALDEVLSDVRIVRTTHEELKDASAAATAIVRTGEATPYANVILHAGVPF